MPVGTPWVGTTAGIERRVTPDPDRSRIGPLTRADYLSVLGGAKQGRLDNYLIEACEFIRLSEYE